MLAFRQRAPAPPAGHEPGAVAGAAVYGGAQARAARSAAASAAALAAVARRARSVPQAPERVLDAPDMIDDYYLNVLDWGSSDQLAVGLGPSVYLWDAKTGGIDELFSLPDASQGVEGTNGQRRDAEYVASVSWAADGRNLAVGLSEPVVQVWDAERRRPVRELRGHAHGARVGALAWSGPLLACGSRDGLLSTHDVRARDSCVCSVQAHDQEVAGLRFSPNGGAQLASGGNDNVALVWDASALRGRDGSARPAHRLAAHRAAVKALAWCPFQPSLLATGGGAADRHIRFWNSLTGAQVGAVDAGSQVTSLAWSKRDRELLSGHGYAHNQLTLWSYPTMTKVAELRGHQGRVLHLAQSPDGATVASAGADETLRFWKVWEAAGRDATLGGAAGHAGGAQSAADAAKGAARTGGLARANGLVRANGLARAAALR